MAETGSVFALHSVDGWASKLQEASASGKLVVVDFTASWCGPCKNIAPFFAELSKKYPNVIFLKVDVDELLTIAQEWKVEAMPTFIYIKDSKAIDKLVGADKKALENKIIQHSATAAVAAV